MTNILILGGGTQGLAMVRSFKDKKKYRTVLLCSERHNYADDSRYVGKVILTDALSDTEEYLFLVVNIIKNEEIDVVFPMGDSSADFVSRNKEKLLAVCNTVIPDYENFIKGYDKCKLMTLCNEKGYPHPRTIDLSKTNNLNSKELKTFPYPAMLKPNCTTGGRGMTEVNSYEEFCNRYPKMHEEFGEYHLQQFINPGGKQIKVQLYLDRQQKLIASSVMQKIRWYPNKAGSNCYAVSIECPELVTLCYSVLKDINWEGFADFDLIEDPKTNKLLIMEINPRLPACIQNAISSGIDYGEIMVNDALRQPQKTYNYKRGVLLRHIGLDFLWLMHTERKWGKALPWLLLFLKKHYYQDMSDWTDPLPFIMGTYHNIKKLFSPEFKKAKSI